jgi:hypothetical protein
MTKDEALTIIDNYKGTIINVGDMIDWTWLRVIVAKIPQEAWDHAVKEATASITRS